MVESSTGEKKRVRVVDQWQPPNLDKKISIEIAVPEDEQLTLDYLINDSRVSEPLLTCSQINEEEAPILLKELNDRSVGSGLSLLMFDGDQLIGIRLTSVHEKPKKLDNYKFELLPDYKEVIDTKAQSSRAQQRLQTFIEMIGDISPNFIPEDCGPEYFDMEMVGIKKEYRGGNLSMRLYQEMFKLAAAKGLRYGKVLCTANASQRVAIKLGMDMVLEIPYKDFKDNGEVCFQNTPDGVTSAKVFIADLKKMNFYPHHN